MSAAETQTGQIILAMDTSSDMLACAVGRVAPDGACEVLADGSRLCRRHANEQLVSVADELVASCGLARADVDALAVGVGPGSFTGVRIGVATAKGLACGLRVPLYAASTLDAVAWAAWRAGVRGRVGVVADAMRKEVYPGLYELTEDGPERLFASEGVCKVPAAVEAWAQLPERDALTLTGDGLKKYRATFEEAGFARFAPEGTWYPTGSDVLAAVARHLHADSGEQATDAGDPALVLPVYTRLSDAEENERVRLGLAEPASVRVTGVDDDLGDIHLQQRPMSVNDLPAVAELEARAYAAGAPTGHACWTQEMFADEYEQPGRTWWVIHDQGTLVGFAGGMVVDGNMEVLDVAVDPARQGQGLARRLLSRIAYDAQMLGARASTLEVAANNAPARHLYEKVGYAQVGLRRGYYGPNAQGERVDALVMRASLPLAIDVEADEPEPRPAVRTWPPADAHRTPEEQASLVAAGALVLAVESSCDETAIAVIDAHGELRANVVSTQIDFHARFGGVVPEIASRKHTEAIVGVYEEAMEQAGASLGLAGPLEPRELACVGVTQGPGLVGALVVGVAFAKGLAWATGKPLVCVNHLEGHLYANLFETPDLKPPFVTSLLSGGHTMLVHVRDWGDYELLGQTLDDAVGEAFDKVAKALGLGYPGGPVISRLAEKGNPRAVEFPRAMLHSHDYRFSLSGLKTAVITYIQQENAAGRPINLPDLAASFQAAVVDVQVAKALAACKQFGVREFCAGGGVTANPALREAFTRELGKRRIRVTLPPKSACTDNAAMIALVAKGKFERGETSPLTADADPNMTLG